MPFATTARMQSSSLLPVFFSLKERVRRGLEGGESRERGEREIVERRVRKGTAWNLGSRMQVPVWAKVLSSPVRLVHNDGPPGHLSELLVVSVQHRQGADRGCGRDQGGRLIQ